MPTKPIFNGKIEAAKSDDMHWTHNFNHKHFNPQQGRCKDIQFNFHTS